jgi:hypothetical protein
MNNMKNTYKVGWSYPTSPNAVSAKMPKTGCWTVEQYIGTNPPSALRHFKPDEKEKAEEMVSKLYFRDFLNKKD